jgi:spore germination cell wall hydrolase CwlJ-like protein
LAPKLSALTTFGLCVCLAMAGLAASLTVWPFWSAQRAAAPGGHRPVTFDFSERALQLQLASFDPAMASLARRFDREGALPLVIDGQAPPPPFASDDLAPLTPAEAVRANAVVPVDNRFDRPASPFSLSGMSSQEADRALDCLTAAVYYESAYEALTGQAAVAQVVLNRVRHPAFPKTVCGVVLQGSERKTGCQFTFTCDGALANSPNPAVWLRARSVASAALGGKVEKSVGHATHYHTIWVRPYWAPSLTKVQVIGAHIFYRWTGGWGLPAAFNGHYLGEGDDPVGLSVLYRALHKPLPVATLVESTSSTLSMENPASALLANAEATASSVPPAASTPQVALVTASASMPVATERIMVGGEVDKPGEYVWREGMTVADAVALAGGYTYRAKKSTVYLQKKDQAEPSKRAADGLTLSPGDRVKIAERFF